MPALKTIQHDLWAASVGTLATLPQAIAYGLVAFAPLGPEWAPVGITASIGCVVIFGLVSATLGSNPFLVSGSRAVTALVMASTIQIILLRGYAPPEAVFVVFSSILAAGIFQILAGILRLGQAVSYVPDPVLTGFVNTSAILVIVSTLPTALGVVPSASGNLVQDIFHYTAPFAVAVSTITVLAHFISNRVIRFIPAAIVGLLTGTGLYYLGTNLIDLPGAPLVGDIGISALLHSSIRFDFPSLEILFDNIDVLATGAITIGLLGAFDTILSSRALDARTGRNSDINAELRLHGILNGLMGFLGFLPGSGTLSRSVAILESGAKTRLANQACSILFAIGVIAFAPVVSSLPLWATSGMLIAIAIQTFDRPTITKIRKVLTGKFPYPRIVIGDILIGLFVIAIALLFNLVVAVFAGIAVSTLLFVMGMGKNPIRRRFTRARVQSRIQRTPSTINWLEQEGHRIGVLELQGAFFFGACSRLRTEFQDFISQGIEYLVLDFRHITSIDSTGATTLRTIHKQCQKAGIQLFLSHIVPERRLSLPPSAAETGLPDTPSNQSHRHEKSRSIWLNLDANGVIEQIGTENFVGETDTALGSCEDLLLRRFNKTSHDRIHGIFTNSMLLAGLTRDQITTLGKTAKRERFTKGQTVFEQGDACSRAYFVVYGRMDVIINVPGNGRKKRIGTFAEGTLFGEFALLDGAPRSATVIASSANALCLSIERGAFETLQRQHQDIVTTLLMNLSKIFAGRLRHANKMISELEQ